jgi:SET domain-containing protein
MDYHPLPKCLEIRKSPIEGMGLFATEKIAIATNLGITHYEFQKELIRTPLGGFYNHSDKPNCQKIQASHQDLDCYVHHLFALRDIEAGEEITVRYTFYNIGE